MCVTHGMPCVNMHGTFEGYKYGVVSRRGEQQEGKGRKKKKERERKEKKREREREGEGEKGKNQQVFLRPTTLRRMEFIGPRSKVRLRDDNYAYVPKAGGFLLLRFISRLGAL